MARLLQVARGYTGRASSIARRTRRPAAASTPAAFIATVMLTQQPEDTASGASAASRSAVSNFGYGTKCSAMPEVNHIANNRHSATPSQRCTSTSVRISGTLRARLQKAVVIATS